MEIATHKNSRQPEREETRKRILLAAQKLFSERGFEATSVRDITTEAVCNVASVNYHFGGKENLYLEAFRDLLPEVRDRRIAKMRRDIANQPEMKLEDFVESFASAFMAPLVDRSSGRFFLGFFAHEMNDPHLPPSVFVEEFIRPLLGVSLEGLGRFGPPMEPMTCRLCLMSVVGQLLHALRARSLFSHHEPAMVPAELEEHIRHIIRFSIGGIRACSDSPSSPVEGIPTMEATP
ncbi:MAG: CerR family C-terminal domain-containing protein [Nitrospirae bacterium]|nr:CerR family C-terminal domain-containing protein [Nitrospirota bacterium]